MGPPLPTALGKVLAWLVLPLLVAGCMSTTPATSLNSMMLNGDTGLVSVLGKKPGDRDRVYAETLAEAARLARTHGYQYFIVIKADDKSVTETKYVLGQNIPYDYTGRSLRPLGSTNLSPANIPGSMYMGPGRSVSSLKPGLEITVKMYRQGEIDSRLSSVWNVDFIPDAASIDP